MKREDIKRGVIIANSKEIFVVTRINADKRHFTYWRKQRAEPELAYILHDETFFFIDNDFDKVLK